MPPDAPADVWSVCARSITVVVSLYEKVPGLSGRTSTTWIASQFPWFTARAFSSTVFLKSMHAAKAPALWPSSSSQK